LFTSTKTNVLQKKFYILLQNNTMYAVQYDLIIEFNEKIWNSAKYKVTLFALG